ncbi:MAG: NADH-quinone oxidoreductase subunit J [Deltaproteobacteria bacterium]|nr:NADH-quinone oxidoreductase subunit J [Deltaproteobacteria bacterium]
MELKEIIFILLVVVTIVSAWLVVSLKHIIHAAFALLITFFGVAGLFVYISADFLAATQILIYVGGVMILVLFAIMLSEKVYNVSIFNRSKILPALLVFGGVQFVLVRVMLESAWRIRPGTASVMRPTTKILGRLLLNDYLLPFELVSVLLLAALIGSVVLIRKEVRRGQRGGEG